MDIIDTKLPDCMGRGIHTGEEGRLNIITRPSGNLKIIFDNLLAAEIPGNVTLGFRSNNGTVLVDISGGFYYTPEHLLAVSLLFWSQPVTITAFGSEAPMGDGSGLPVLLSIGKVLAKFKNGNNPGFKTYKSVLCKKYENDEGSFLVEPSDEFSVTYKVIKGDVKEEFTFGSHEPGAVQTYLNEIIPARTFIFWEDYRRCLKKDLLKGVSFDSGILVAESQKEYREIKNRQSLPFLDDYPYLNRKGFRMDNEFAKHKILDLMGDLAMMDLSLPRLKINITNGGHFQNHLLIKDLIHERKNK